jgi:hypothetical protein
MIDRRSKTEEFRSAIRARDPSYLAALLKLGPVASTKHANPPRKGVSENLKENGTDWSGVLSAWLDASEAAEAVGCFLQELNWFPLRGARVLTTTSSSLSLSSTTAHSRTRTQGYAILCYESQSALHTAFNQLFGASVGNKLVPALHAVCKTTHRVALAADTAANNSHEHAKLQNAVSLLQESFSRTFNDRKELVPNAPFDEEGSKKAGVLSIVNELFSIYFELNTLRLCKNLLRPVELRKLHQQGAIGQLVTYRYYVGRLNMFEDQYSEAEQNLQFAFDNCHKNAVHNKKCILRYLVPVKLYRGRLPSAQCK